MTLHRVSVLDPPLRWRGVLASLAAVAILGGTAHAADPPPDVPEPGAHSSPRRGGPAESPARGELRVALRDYYVHALMEDLRVSPDRVPELERTVRALLETQRTAARQRADLLLAIETSVDEGGEGGNGAAGLASQFHALDASTARDVAAARLAVTKLLEPEQAARFLAFEDQFRNRVRELAGEPADGSRPPLGGRPEGRRPPGNPAPPGQGPHGADAGGPGPRSGRGLDGPPGDPGPRAQEAIETLKLALAHEVRTRLGLDRETTLDLLPDLDAFVDTRMRLHRQRGQRTRQLADAVESGSATSADLRALVQATLDADEKASSDLATARKGVMAHLPSEAAARFLLFERRFERDMQQRLRDILQRQGGSHPRGRPALTDGPRSPPGPGEPDDAPRHQRRPPPWTDVRRP